MNRANREIYDAAKATPLSKISRAYDPFVELTPLGNPLMPKGFVKENQFKHYMLRWVENGEFIIDLYGNQGRALSYSLRDFYKSRYAAVDSSRNWDDQIHSQIDKLKMRESLKVILPITKRDKRITRNAINSFNYTLADDAPFRSVNTLPSLSFGFQGEWTVYVASTKTGRHLNLASAQWYDKDALQSVAELFSDLHGLEVIFALQYPEASRLLHGDSFSF